MKVFMTSSPMGAYRSAEAPSFRGLDPSNGLVDELKRYAMGKILYRIWAVMIW